VLDSSAFKYAVKLSCLKFQPNNDMAFHIKSYDIKGQLASMFGVPARFHTDHYLICHGKNDDQTYYFDVYFKDPDQAILFKLSYLDTPKS
jgi:hypothetical protein